MKTSGKRIIAIWLVIFILLLIAIPKIIIGLILLSAVALIAILIWDKNNLYKKL